MTPDLKRLCEAAAASSAPVAALGLRSPDDADLIYGSPEAIVRAVLMELREVGEEPLAAGAVDLLRLVTDPWDCMPADLEEALGFESDPEEAFQPAEERMRPSMKRAFTAMLNSILAEPA